MARKRRDYPYRPGQWPNLTKAERRRLNGLARRQLRGYEHLAEDAVSLACIRWERMSPDTADALLEQVVKSEAHSLRRSDERARNRDTRFVTDRSKQAVEERRQIELWLAMKACANELGIEIGSEDREVIGLLFSGYNMADVERLTPLSRYEIKRSRATWQQILQALFTDIEAC